MNAKLKNAADTLLAAGMDQADVNIAICTLRRMKHGVQGNPHRPKFPRKRRPTRPISGLPEHGDCHYRGGYPNPPHHIDGPQESAARLHRHNAGLERFKASIHAMRLCTSGNHVQESNGQDWLTPSQTDRFNASIEMVNEITYAMAARLPSNITADDLLTDAMIGLADACKKFDPSKGIRFGAYAQRRITGTILDAIRREDWAPRSARANGAEATKMLHMESLAVNDENEPCAFMAEDNRTNSLQDRETVTALVSMLPLDQKFVVVAYYLADYTMLEIAEAMKLCEARICQIHAKAMGRMRGEVSKVV